MTVHSLLGKRFSHPVLLYDSSEKLQQHLLKCLDYDMDQRQRLSGDVMQKGRPRAMQQLVPTDCKLVVQ